MLSAARFPGLTLVGAGMAVVPTSTGKALWIKFFPPDAYAERIEYQREFLQGIRAENEWATATALGISKRTWEGWEQLRPMPFHVVCSIIRRTDPTRAGIPVD